MFNEHKDYDNFDYDLSYELDPNAEVKKKKKKFFFFLNFF
jgi:hypothetical protein